MRVLILSASVGAGHVRAAEAVEAALRQTRASVTIAHYDVLTLMPPAFRKVYREGYFKMAVRVPKVLGWLYEASDKPFHQDVVRLKVEQAGAGRLLKKIANSMLTSRSARISCRPLCLIASGGNAAAGRVS